MNHRIICLLILLVLLVSTASQASPSAPFIALPAYAKAGSPYQLVIHPVPQATEYQIYEGEQLVKTQTSESASFTDYGQAVKRYRVKACNAAGCSEFSHEALIYVRLAQSASPNIKVPVSVAVGEQFCIELTEATGASRYVYYRNGHVRVGQCTQLDQPGWASFWVVPQGSALQSTIFEVYAYEPGVLPEREQVPIVSAPEHVSQLRTQPLAYTQVPGATYYEIFENNQLNGTSEQLSYTPKWSGERVRKFKVRACNGQGCGAFGNTAVTVGYTLAVNLSVPEIGYSKQTFCIAHDNSPGADRYYLKYGNASQSIAAQGCTAFNEPGFYALSLMACAPCSQRSGVDNILIIPGKPQGVQGFKASKIRILQGEQVTFTFDPPATTSGQTRYELFREGKLTERTVASPFSINEPQPGLYNYQVRACNEAGCGDLSESVQVNVGLPPVEVTPLASVYLENEQPVTLRWASLGADVQYQVYYTFNGTVQHFPDFISESWVEIGPLSGTGTLCMFVSARKLVSDTQAVASPGASQSCTTIHRRTRVVRQTQPEIVLAQGQSYTLSVTDFEFESPNGHNGVMRPALMSPGANYVLSEDTLTLTPDPGFFGELTVHAVFKDNKNVETNPIELRIKVIDGRPSVPDVALPIKHKTRWDYISTYNANSDPRGLPIVKAEITLNPVLGTARIHSDLKHISYTHLIGELCAFNDTITDFFEYQITNSAGLVSEPIRVTLTMDCPYDPTPIARGDVYNYHKNKAITFDPLDNRCNDGYAQDDILPEFCIGDDFDPYDYQIKLNRITLQPHTGTLTVVGKTVIYSPKPDTCVTDWFMYTIVNSNGLESKPALVRLECGFRPALTHSDTAHLFTGQSVRLNVLANDEDLNDPPLPLRLHSITTQPEKGLVTINHDNTLTYTNTETCYGGHMSWDRFAYQIRNGADNAAIEPGKVTIEIMCGALDIKLADRVIENGSSTQISWRLPTGYQCQEQHHGWLATEQGTIQINQPAKGTYDYLWQCSNKYNAATEQVAIQLQVVDVIPQQMEISWSDKQVRVGQAVQLRWSLSPGVECYASPWRLTNTGSKSVMISRSGVHVQSWMCSYSGSDVPVELTTQLKVTRLTAPLLSQ